MSDRHEGPPESGRSGAKPEDFSHDSSMWQDTKAVGREIRKKADPRRLAKDAALTFTGVKPAVDAAKTTSRAVDSTEETEPGQQHPATATGGRHRRDAVEPGENVASEPEKPAPEQDAAATPGATQPKKAADETPEKKTGAAQKVSTGKQDVNVARTVSGKGGRGGALGATKFVRKSNSDGTAKGDALSVADGAATGAQIGSRFGAQGAAVGAAVGAVIQGSKTRRGRRVLGTSLVITTTPFWLPLLLAMSLIMVLIITSGSVYDVMANSADETSQETVIADGVDANTVRIAADAGGDIPWQILAAIVDVNGNVASEDEVEPLTAEEVEDAMSDGAPVGPYSIDLNAFSSYLSNVHFRGWSEQAAERFIRTSPVGSDEDEETEEEDKRVVFSVAPYKTDVELFGHLVDYSSATEVVSGLLTTELKNLENPPDSFALDAGVYLSSKTGNDFHEVRRAYEPETSDETETTSESAPETTDPDDGEPEMEADVTDGNTESKALREAYITALKELPIDGIDGNAEQIYDQAMSWYLAMPKPTSSQCTPPGNVVISGAWANPLPGSPPPNSEQDFGPRRTGQGFHDGVDLNGAAEGSPVMAASAGVVSVEASVGYGAQWVKIDHGNGVQTEYGHLKSADVRNGDQVQPGQVIGMEGNEGTWSRGIHLHFSIRENGEFVDPVPFMAARGVDLFGTGDGTPPIPVGPIPQPADPSKGLSGTQIRTVQANLPSRRRGELGDALNKVYAETPDFVAFNEMFGVADARFTPTGYAAWRAPRGKEHPESMGNAVTWRLDRWQKVSTGRTTLVRNGPLPTDNRYANWVTVNNAELGNVSFVSAHMPINPAVHKPLKKRQEMYRKGMERLQGLVSELSTQGPVFVGGDMNSQFSANDPWGPRKMLGTVGMQSSFEVLGVVPTHVGGGTIDYIFGQKNAATPIRQWTEKIPSDHNMLGVDWDMNPEAVINTGTLPDSWEATSTRPGSPETVTLDRTQLEFAATIAAKASQMGVPDDGIVIAYMTVFVESKFKNYASDKYPETIGHEYPSGSVGSDHDSVGLFQQRPQSGWGDPMELLDPSYTASAFFGGKGGPNKGSPAGLLDQPAGWETRDKGKVAQSVQVSAHPDKYAHWEQAATELLSLVKAAGGQTDPDCAPVAAGVGYTVASFNVLGWAHTAPPNGRKGWPGGEVRFPAAMKLLSDNDVSIAGLQEMHDANKNYLATHYKDEWDWEAGKEDYVIWRKDEWTKVGSKTLTIPYFGGAPRLQAMVKLRRVDTGEEIWFANIHNPADTRGNALAWRKEALAIEKRAVTEADAPVILVGDFNDRRDGTASSQCMLTPLMTNAFGPSAKGCERPPGDATVDHIYSKGLMLSSARVDKSPQNEKISDHPLVLALVPSMAPGIPTPGPTPGNYNLGPVQAHVAQAANTLGPMFGIQVIGGYRVEATRDPLGHPAGLALDFMVPLTPEGQAQGNALAAYAQQNAASLRIAYIIWNQRIWSVARAGEGWRNMADRGSPTQNHIDHVHISFKA